MKKTLFLILFVVGSLAASAQLKVTSDGKVIIASNQSTSGSAGTVLLDHFFRIKFWR
jgi:branched-subunit amino acid permease